jgi:hypothetical protein
MGVTSLAALDRATGNVVRVFPVGNTLAKADPEDRRGAPRRRVLKAAIVAYNDRHSTLPCMVRDLSATGARLRADNSIAIPDTFELIVELDGLEARCEVVWRRDGEVGVKFASAPRMVAPKRAQVVGAPVPAPKPSLRRKPLPQTPSSR